MSNALIRAAHRVRGLSPAERLVLVALADDARDHLGGRSRLTAREIEARTELTDRSIRRILGRLVTAGHITREAGAAGAAVVTLVHPDGPVSAPVEVICPAHQSPPSPDARVRPPRTQESAPHIIDQLPGTSSPQARTRDAEFQDRDQPAVAPAPDDPVTRVFVAWDAMRDRAGLPGPVQRDMARRVAVLQRIEAIGIDRVLALIETVGRSPLTKGIKRRGQDDWFVTFDQVFEVGHAAGLRVFTRLLDGEWGTIAAAPRASASGFAAANVEGKEEVPSPPDIVRLRQLLAEKVDARAFENWIAPLAFEHDPGGALRIFAPSAFIADWARSNYAGMIATAARAVWPSCDAVLFGVAKVRARDETLSVAR